VYARSYVRAFAAAVGLDPDIALATLEELLPGAPDPVPALNARRIDEWPVEWLLRRRASLHAALKALAESAVRSSARARQSCIEARAGLYALVAAQGAALGSVPRKLRERTAPPQFERLTRPCVRVLTAAVATARRVNENDVAARTALDFIDASMIRCLQAGEALSSRGRRWKETALARLPVPLPRVGRALHAATHPSIEALRSSPAISRCSAAAIDAALLLAVDTFLVLLISWSSGIPVDSLLRDSGWALGAFCAIPIALYFLLFGGIAGSTLGGYVCDLVEPLRTRHVRQDHPLTLPDILRRAVGR
jgi:hypothetical protein